MISLPRKTELRRRLTAISRSVHESVISQSVSLEEPQSSTVDSIVLQGMLLKRKRIVLLAPACVSATCTMCPLPNEAIDINRRAFSQENLIRQFEHAFCQSDIHSFDAVTVYCNGNFFADREISPKVRNSIYKRLAQSSAKYLIVESLPNFITAQSIKTAKELLGRVRLVVSMGLQSADDDVRDVAINTVCTKEAFERVVHMLNECTFIPQVFCMVKPPFLTEQEAIGDAVGTLEYVQGLGVHEVILCPTKVSRHTVLSKIFTSKRFSPPWFWTIVTILNSWQARRPEFMPIVATSVMRKTQYDLAWSHSCDMCQDLFMSAFNMYNRSRNVGEFQSINCTCKREYELAKVSEQEKYASVPLELRIDAFLEQYRL